MAQRPVGASSKNQTPLARMRLRVGMSQKEVWLATGISQKTYERLERGTVQKVNLAHYVNCAKVLGCPLENILPEQALRWTEFTVGVREPADASALWRKRSRR